MQTAKPSAFLRFAALFLAIFLVFPVAAPFARRDASKTVDNAVPALLSGSPGDGLLTESDEYQYVLSAYLNGQTEISAKTGQFTLTKAEMSRIFTVMFYSEAELFISGNGYREVEINGEFTAIRPVYAIDATEIPSKLAEFRALTAAIISEADPEWSEWEKIAFVHDYLALHYDYDQRVYSKDEEEKAQAVYDAYGMLKEGVGVCQAYSLLARYLLKQLGVECECVSCGELNHEWNIVRIGGSWYHVDVTWDDRDDKGLYGQVSHEYFLSSDTHFNAGKHNCAGWDAPVRATNGKFDGFFEDVTTPFILTDGAIYAINDGRLVSYDPKTEQFTLLRDLSSLKWSTQGGVWEGFYAGLCYLENGNLYWNTSNEIWSYDPRTGTATRVDTYNDSSLMHRKIIFGMRAETEGNAIVFTLAMMRNPNDGNPEEIQRSPSSYVITWQICDQTYETVCLRNEVPACDEALLVIPSNVFDYAFLGWDRTPVAATKDATYTAKFRMDRNETVLTSVSLREQYRLLRAARRLLPYAGAGYDEAAERVTELNDLLAVYAAEVDAVNAAFSAVLFGGE